MDMRSLAKLHQETCRTLSHRPIEALLLWYADLGLEVDEAAERIHYHCPKCGKRIAMDLNHFLYLDKSLALRCNDCWGDRQELGGE
ncbi:MAG: hypothetical protein HYY31_03980 [Chloroflexi bacterium]|nr:hypothetical protein [Chloroflexota bacterium]